MESSPDSTRDLKLLEQIESNPDATQASMASQLGVAVGTVNWHIKRLISKGYVKVKRAERKKLRYIITPEGIAHRALLTVDYIDQQFQLYRRTRDHVGDLLAEVKQAGYSEVRINGDGDVADICRLTCLENGITVTKNSAAPSLEIDGIRVKVHFEEAA
ncbi:MAG: winged helix-turn-helix transcriptional regulator [Anaerolineales bacterium]|nr:winged helix-turn-helix transcriptional regulator [Anaerolineales bacterium]